MILVGNLRSPPLVAGSAGIYFQRSVSPRSETCGESNTLSRSPLRTSEREITSTKAPSYIIMFESKTPWKEESEVCKQQRHSARVPRVDVAFQVSSIARKEAPAVRKTEYDDYASGLAAPGPVGMISPASLRTAAK